MLSGDTRSDFTRTSPNGTYTLIAAIALPARATTRVRPGLSGTIRPSSTTAIDGSSDSHCTSAAIGAPARLRGTAVTRTESLTPVRTSVALTWIDAASSPPRASGGEVESVHADVPVATSAAITKAL